MLASLIYRGLPVLAALVVTVVPARAQQDHGAAGSEVSPGGNVSPAEPRLHFASLSDSLAWEQAREAAHTGSGQRLVVSVLERQFWWMNGPEVLRTGPVAVGKGTELAYGDKVWKFETPRGVRRVLRKAQNPVWIPPEWHYVELAQDSSLTLVHLERGEGARLVDGSRLEVRGERIVHLRNDGSSEVIPPDEEIVFGDTLFVPPYGTANRQIPGELGAFKLELGDGYMLHGTPDQGSIGKAATHGCIRLADADIEYLFINVPTGTPVHIY